MSNFESDEFFDFADFRVDDECSYASDKNIVLKYGIDFGTTNSSIALKYTNEYGEEAKVHCFDIYGMNLRYLKDVLPSVVCYHDSITNVAVGHEAKRIHCHKAENFNKLIKKVKTDIIECGYDVEYSVGEHRIFASDVIAEILKMLLKKAKSYYKTETDGVVMGVPVGITDTYKFIIYKALVKAGFYQNEEEARMKTEFVSEPVAAVLNYQSEIKKEQVIFVFDFGGGTLDLVVAEVLPDKTSKVLSKVGITLGGERLTELFFKNYFVPKIGLKNLTEQFHLDHVFDADSLWKKLEQCEDGVNFINEIDLLKMTLSTSTVEDFRFIGQKTNALVEIYDVTRADFEKSIDEIIPEIKNVVNRCVKESGISAREIENVYMAGGSSLIPCIQRLLHSGFSSRVQPVNSSTLTSIARGLAIQGYRQDVDEVLISDISEFDYGVWDEERNCISVIIAKGANILDTKINKATVTSKYHKNYKMESMSVSRFDIRVYQGSDEIGIIPINNVGSGRYTIFFEIDTKNAMLTVSMYDRIDMRWYDDQLLRLNNTQGVF